jgi:hypothetical protein
MSLRDVVTCVPQLNRRATFRTLPIALPHQTSKLLIVPVLLANMAFGIPHQHLALRARELATPVALAKSIREFRNLVLGYA